MRGASGRPETWGSGRSLQTCSSVSSAPRHRLPSRRLPWLSPHGNAEDGQGFCSPPWLRWAHRDPCEKLGVCPGPRAAVSLLAAVSTQLLGPSPSCSSNTSAGCLFLVQSGARSIPLSTHSEPPPAFANLALPSQLPSLPPPVTFSKQAGQWSLQPSPGARRPRPGATRHTHVVRELGCRPHALQNCALKTPGLQKTWLGAIRGSLGCCGELRRRRPLTLRVPRGPGVGSRAEPCPPSRKPDPGCGLQQPRRTPSCPLGPGRHRCSVDRQVSS